MVNIERTSSRLTRLVYVTIHISFQTAVFYQYYSEFRILNVYQLWYVKLEAGDDMW